MPRLDTFEPQPVADAKQADTEISEDTAISRLRTIQNGVDYRSTAVTVSGGSAPV
jgi:hypothetical protein